MNCNSMYFGKNELYNKIKSVGGQWADTKKRPIVCLIESKKHPDIYWAIPMGNYNHRDPETAAKILVNISRPDKDLRSCYHHIGKTTVKSIFFISDAIPITQKYIDEEYVGYDSKPYIIKNKILLKELERKLERILAYEESKPNYFRQHITDIYNLLVAELI